MAWVWVWVWAWNGERLGVFGEGSGDGTFHVHRLVFRAALKMGVVKVGGRFV
ncbi:hypothetical protein [Desulfosporosinus fructosivorans]|uniref:hypothetical protein n=1 Tax=Desulfosporosinus fructosivorans TaxID=2018669 RepID=UPI001A7EAC44|nr:hypothetical protein [Desulfosporosinus fructosivorans]